jgi:hypothetical protein
MKHHFINVKNTEEFYLLEYNAVQSIENQPIFWRYTLFPFSGSKNKPSKKPAYPKRYTSS